MSQRYALLVANSIYNDPTFKTLTSPLADVEALAKVLSDPKIGDFSSVETLIDQPLTTIMKKIEIFLQKKSSDLLLLYFSGHGLTNVWGNFYIIAKDTDKQLLASTAISDEFVTRVMNRNFSPQVLILDCCYSGAFGQGTKGNDQDGEHIAKIFSGKGRVIFTATGASQLAWEGGELFEKKSVFSHYLVQGLETGDADLDTDGWISTDELYTYVYERVLNEKTAQIPGKWVEKQQGQIYLARNIAVQSNKQMPDEKRGTNLESSLLEATQKRASDKYRVVESKDSSLGELSFQEKSTLVEKLLACPSVRNNGSRETIIKQLPIEISSGIERQAASRADIFNIVDTCMKYPDGLQALINVVRFFEKESRPMQYLEAFMEELFDI